MLRRIAAALLAAALLPPAAAPAQQRPLLTAMMAYDTLQAARRSAGALLARGDTTGIVMLERAILWAARPEIRDLAQGNTYLNARAPNILHDLFQAHLTRKDTARALDALERMVAAGASSSYLWTLKEDTLTRQLDASPRYRRILDAYRQEQRRWQDSAFVTPSTATLTPAQKAAGIGLLWAEVKWGFAGFPLVPHLDWDSLYIATIPEALAAPDTWSYYQVLRRMVAKLHDSHTNVWASQALWDSLYRRPAIRTEKVEGKVLVLRVDHPELERLGLTPGQEIVRIDGRPVEEYATTEVLPTASWATPQDRDIRVYHFDLLRGPRDVPVRVTVRDGRGAEREIAVPRNLTGARRLPIITGQRVVGDLAYVAINTFADDSVAFRFDSVMKALGPVKGVIIDVRQNGGGNSTPGWDVLRRFASDSIPTPVSTFRTYGPTRRAWGLMPLEQTISPGDRRAPIASPRYDVPLAVLIGPTTFSAAEDFAAVFDMMGRKLLIGEATGGNTGQPLPFPLPGGGSARVRTKHDRYQDGTEFIGVGIQPDVLVRSTVAGIRAGRDEVLEAAIARLRTGGK